jgi:hypothetical protein
LTTFKIESVAIIARSAGFVAGGVSGIARPSIFHRHRYPMAEFGF